MREEKRKERGRWERVLWIIYRGVRVGSFAHMSELQANRVSPLSVGSTQAQKRNGFIPPTKHSSK